MGEDQVLLWPSKTPIKLFVLSQVHRPHMGDWYEIDGYYANGGKISHEGLALPSQDGNYWIFYRDYPAAGDMGQQAASPVGVYCFFVPMAF